MKETCPPTNSDDICTIVKKNPGHRTGPRLASRCENCHSVSEYWSFCARIASCCPGAFSYLWGRKHRANMARTLPPVPLPAAPFRFSRKKSERRKGRWKSPSITTDKPWPWRSRWKSMNFLTGPTTKPRTCPMSSGGHWDGREFDEYIVATEGVGIYGETPEEYLCRMENAGRADGPSWTPAPRPSAAGSCSMPWTG